MQKMVSISDRTEILVVFTVSSVRPLCGVVVIDFLVTPSIKRSNKLESYWTLSRKREVCYRRMVHRG